VECFKACTENAEDAAELVHGVIQAIYPKYYPAGIVDFFLAHHSIEKIRSDIDKGNVLLLKVDDQLIGTGSRDENGITRVYVAESHQGKGYGSFLMQKLEDEIAKQYDSVLLDASLPASRMYEKRGYKVLCHKTREISEGAILAYEIMGKSLKKSASEELYPRDGQIATDRLVIRRFKADDGIELHEYLSQPETVQFEPYEPLTLNEAKSEAACRAIDYSFHAVCLKGSGKLIGNVYISRRGFDSVEIGYVFNKDFCGKGYATEAARTLLGAVFSKWKAHRAFAECNPLNERSWRLLERLGFRREGRLMQNIYFKRGADGGYLWQDTFVYGILEEEWNKQ
jgi:RimJ/RimL family protein N-acetyltransferase